MIIQLRTANGFIRRSCLLLVHYHWPSALLRQHCFRLPHFARCALDSLCALEGPCELECALSALAKRENFLGPPKSWSAFTSSAAAAPNKKKS